MLFLESGAGRFALPASAVVEVVPAVPLHAAPGGPPGFAGVFRYRGAVTPVLGLAPAGPPRLSGRIVVVEGVAPGESAPRRLGLLAERVTELKPLHTTGPAFAHPPAGGPDFGPLYAAADGVVRVLDPAALLASVYPPAGGPT